MLKKMLVMHNLMANKSDRWQVKRGRELWWLLTVALVTAHQPDVQGTKLSIQFTTMQPTVCDGSIIIAC